MALELVSGANFGRVLQHLSGPTRSKGSRGQVRLGIGKRLECFDSPTIQFLDLPHCQIMAIPMGRAFYRKSKLVWAWAAPQGPES